MCLLWDSRSRRAKGRMDFSKNVELNKMPYPCSHVSEQHMPYTSLHSSRWWKLWRAGMWSHGILTESRARCRRGPNRLSIQHAVPCAVPLSRATTSINTRRVHKHAASHTLIRLPLLRPWPWSLGDHLSRLATQWSLPRNTVSCAQSHRPAALSLCVPFPVLTAFDTRLAED